MGLFDKLATGMGVAVVGAVVASAAKNAQEEKRRRNSYLHFSDGISQEEFVELAERIGLRLPRVSEVFVIGMTVVLDVDSNTGLTTWSAVVDFNDYGHLTGTYWLNSENDDSPIPDRFADLMQAEVVRRLSAAQEAKSSWAPAVTAAPASATLPPAAWYPDPYRVARFRYWDGRAWTHHLAQ
ncbi:DUF2510 domain-containing protein [Nocardioides silvaticus]|nr:DUF2510 domain-containing protein [Nocardioides silvaticus]